MSLELWISIVGLILVPLGIGYVSITNNRRDKDIEERRKAREERDKQVDATCKELRQYIERVNESLLTQRLELSQTYISRAAAQDMEMRIARTLERLEKKLDNFENYLRKGHHDE